MVPASVIQKRAIIRWVSFFRAFEPSVTFDVGAFGERNTPGRIAQRWLGISTAELVDLRDQLAAFNADGANILARPAAGMVHPFLLVDDVEEGTMVNCARLELATSWAGRAVWLCGDRVLSEPDRSRFEYGLITLTGSGDPYCADGGHFSRLPGFSNRKPEHCRNGCFPWVRVLRSRVRRPRLTLDRSWDNAPRPSSRSFPPRRSPRRSSCRGRRSSW